MNGKFEFIQWGRAILLTLLSLVVAISIALFIVINISPFFITIPKHLLGLSASELMTDYGNIIKYIQLPTQRALELNYLPIAPSAVHHFKDVKHLILLNEAVMVVSIPLLVFGLKKQNKGKYTEISHLDVGKLSNEPFEDDNIMDFEDPIEYTGKVKQLRKRRKHI